MFRYLVSNITMATITWRRRGVLLAHFLRITLDALVALEDARLGGLHHHIPLHQGLVFVQA